MILSDHFLIVSMYRIEKIIWTCKNTQKFTSNFKSVLIFVVYLEFCFGIGNSNIYLKIMVRGNQINIICIGAILTPFKVCQLDKDGKQNKVWLQYPTCWWTHALEYAFYSVIYMKPSSFQLRLQVPVNVRSICHLLIN